MKRSYTNNVFAWIFIGLLFYSCSCRHKEPIIPVVHISYDTPVDGYTVSVKWYPTDSISITPGDSSYITWGPADIVLHNDKTKKDILISSDGISVPKWIFTERELKAEESLVLHYTPFGTMEDVIPVGNEQIVFFADLDFDGEKELIINCFKGGTQEAANTYTAFNLTDYGAEMIDYPPFFGKEERFEDYRVVFHSETKTVEGIYGTGINQYSKVYQFDGSGNAPVLIKERESEAR